MYDLAGLRFISNIMSVNINSHLSFVMSFCHDILMTLDAFLTLVKDVSVCIALIRNWHLEMSLLNFPYIYFNSNMWICCRVWSSPRRRGASWQADVSSPWVCEPAGHDGQASVLCKSCAAWPYIIHHSHHGPLSSFIPPSPGILPSLPASLSPSYSLNSSAPINSQSLSLLDSLSLPQHLTLSTVFTPFFCFP